VLTASGGPFRTRDPATLGSVTPDEACAHPNWVMGRKISVDSATMMNKALEVIEARWLFDLQPEQIRVVIHPQSIIHSMVVCRDGSVLAQLGTPDMRGADRLRAVVSAAHRIRRGAADFDAICALSFEQADALRFPGLQLSWAALRGPRAAPRCSMPPTRWQWPPSSIARWASMRSMRSTPTRWMRCCRGSVMRRRWTSCWRWTACACACAPAGAGAAAVITTVLAFLVTLAILVVIHEYGHYRVAVACGVKVLRFSVGFGRVLWRRQRGPDGTEFVLCALPLGGYVRMLDEREAPVAPDERDRAFNRQSLARRTAIVAAGPAANLLLAVLLFALVQWIGVPSPKAVLSAPGQQLVGRARRAALRRLGQRGVGRRPGSGPRCAR
jgi:hypothetical protein